MKQRVFLVGWCVLVVTAVFASGKNDVETRTPENPASWNESFDLSAKKKGKYNALVTAEDIAGNEGYAGPFNMYVDPNSDLPVVSITNPIEGMGITGSLSAAGTAFDDDGLDYIEVALDNGEPVRAKGTQFWSYLFPTSGLEEGAHTITAWGIDINGLKGKGTVVSFNLNLNAPETTITNMDAGALISGKRTIEGIVEDGNGIEKLFYSFDSGETYIPLSVKYNKKNKIYSFKLDLDTRKMPEGPTVCWFKAVDKLGAEGVSTFLFFIDNTPPVVDFFYPPSSEIVGSVFGIAGSAIDTVNLESVSWKLGKQSGVFEEVKGNPYWVKEFDVSQSSSSSETIEITAKDIAGNITTVSRTIKIDKKLDLPQLKIAQPVQNASTNSSVYLAGFVESAFGISEIRYKVDKEAEVSVPVTLGPFGVYIDNLTAGKHTVSVYAVNPQGVKGNTDSVSFSVIGAKPVIGLDGTDGFVQVLPADNKGNVAINVSAVGTGLQAVSYSIAGDAAIDMPIKRGASGALIRIPLDASYSGKVTPVVVRATDVYDRTVSQTILLESQAVAEEASFLWAEGNKMDNGTLILSDSQQLIGVYHPAGEVDIASVEFSDSSLSAEVSFSGRQITLSGVSEGFHKNVQIIITDTEGNTFTSTGVDILVDNSAPVITLNEPDEPRLVKDSVDLSGSVTDISALQSISYTVGDSDEMPLTANFSQKIALDSYPDGLIVIGVHAVDVLGQKRSEYRTFYKNTQGPQVTMLFPREGDKVNGSIIVGFKPENYNLLAKAEYKPEGADRPWEPIEISPILHRVIGTAASPISMGMQFRFTDKLGNSLVYNDYGFEIDTEADKPVIEVHLPIEDAIIVKDFVLSGVVYDDDGVSKVFYQIDEGPVKSLEVTDSFSVPFALTDFTDNEHVISIYAEDIYGVKSNVFKRQVRVSLEPPEAEILAPATTVMVRDIISVTGTAKDKNGIESIEISLDNGNTYNKVDVAESWRYTFNTKVIADGTHAIFVRTTDKYGQSSVITSLLNIDNGAPVLKFDYPIAGGHYDSELVISGQVYDEIALKDIVLHIKGLEGQTVPAKFANMMLEYDLLAVKTLNIAELAEGSYNLEIVGSDAAGNLTNIARNFIVDRSNDKGKIDLLYPLTGDTLIGEFSIYGRISSTIFPESVTLYVDGKEQGTCTISAIGYFHFDITPETLAAGDHKIAVKAEIVKNKPESSMVHTITYNPVGPWITVDNFAMGDFAVDRPYLRGHAGYSLSEEDQLILQDKTAAKELKAAIAEKQLESVEISLDNGRSFMSVGTKSAWKYRLETGDMAEGEHYLLVRARMKNGEVAVSRMIVSVDKTAPVVTLITPDAGGLYNQSLVYAGLTSDNVAVTNVTVALRKGDKYFYSVPAVLQGLHFEAGFWGATLWDIGVGLSFFSNSVKLQLHYGQYLESQWNWVHKGQGIKMRYGGHIFGLKILASVFELPFERFAGPDWSWLYLTAALGANFSIFTQTQSGKPQVLAALLGQIEFPRVKLPKKKVKYFRSFAVYTEGQLWFIPTDVSDGIDSKKDKGIQAVIPRVSVGIRVDVF